MKRFLTLMLAIVILMITDLGCASTQGNSNIYRNAGFTTEFKYYDSSKGEKCDCPPPKNGDNYVCECIDTKDDKK
jgi:hypothetical protein